MAPPVKEDISIPKIRTYANDVREAQKALENMPNIPGEGTQNTNDVFTAEATGIKGTGSTQAQDNAVPVIGTDVDVPVSHDFSGEPLDIREESSDTQKGVIVKDSRSKQWSFTNEIGKAFREWIDSLSGRNKKPISIAPASSRAPIIKAASAESRIAPQDDHSSLALRTKQASGADEESEDKMLRTIPEQQKPNWTYIDPKEKQKNLKEIGQILAALENRQPRKQGSPSIKRRRPIIRAGEEVQEYEHEDVMPKEKEQMFSPDVPPAMSEYGEELPEEIENENATASDQESAGTEEQPEQTQGAEPDAEDAEKEIRPQPEPTQIIEPSHAEDTAPREPIAPVAARAEAATEPRGETPDPQAPTERKLQEPAPIAARGAIMNEMRSTGPRAGDLYALRAEEKAREGSTADETVSFTTYIAGAVILLFFAGAVFGGFYFFTNRAPETPRNGNTVLFSTENTVPVQLPEGRAQILAELLNHVQSATGITGSLTRYQLTEQGTDRVFSTQAFLNTLSQNVPGTLVRTAHEPFVFGAYIDAQNAPFIAFPVRNRDAAYAGMLEWERSMHSDLSPLFGGRLTSAPEFRDEVVSAFDARVLYDKEGSVQIIYALVDSSTVVISSSRSALGAVIRALGGR